MLTERTLFIHDIINSAEKPSGLLDMKLWMAGVAKPHATRERSLTFGPGTRDMSSVATTPYSRATSMSSTTAHTSSNDPQSESEPTVFHGGLEDEKDNLEEL